MILSEIKTYLKKHKRVTLGDLVCHFDIEPEAMKGMLGQWITKGRVLTHTGHAGCSRACGKCGDGAAMEIYEWNPRTFKHPDNASPGIHRKGRG